MNADDLRDHVLTMLDEEAAKHTDGLKSADQRALVHGRVVRLLADLPRDLDAEAEALLLEVSRSSRRRRRASMAANIDSIVSGFGEAGGYVDPLMDMAFPIGTDDGQVKALRYWTAEDFAASTRMAYRKSAEATAAARDHDDACHRAIGSMKVRGTQMFGGAA